MEGLVAACLSSSPKFETGALQERLDAIARATSWVFGL